MLIVIYINKHTSRHFKARTNIQKQIIESTDKNYFLSKTKGKSKFSILSYSKQETSHGSPDVTNLDLDLTLESFWTQKCLPFSSVIVKSCTLVLSTNIQNLKWKNMCIYLGAFHRQNCYKAFFSFGFPQNLLCVNSNY